MDQASSLSDSLSKTPGALASLMAMVGPDESTTTEGLFSDLVAAELPKEAPADDAVLASTAIIPARLSSLPDVNAAIQDAKDLAAVLQKILSVLRGQEIGESDVAEGDTETTDDRILSPSDAADKPATLAETLAEVSASNDAEKTLSDIVSELLMLAQLIVSALQQAMVTTGGTSSAEAPAPAFTSAATEWAENPGPAYALLATAILTLSDTERDLAVATKEASQIVHRLFEALFSLAKAVRDEKHDGDSFFASADTAAPSSEDIAAALVSLNVKETSLELKQTAIALKKALFAFQETTRSSGPEKRDEAATNQATDTTSAASDADAAAELSPDVLMDPGGLTPLLPRLAPKRSVVLSADEDDTPKLSARAAVPQGLVSASLSAPRDDGDASPAAQAIGENKKGSFPWAGPEADSASSITLTRDKAPEGLSVLGGEGAQATGNYSFASTLSAFRAVNGGGTGLPSAVDQVILHLNRSVKEGQSSLTLQLQPADLGKITVKLDVKDDGQVQGTVIAEKPQTLEMLQKDSRSLERALQDAGLRAESGSLQFSLSGERSNNANQTAGGNERHANGPEIAGSEGGADVVGIGTSEHYYITPNGVNIQV